MGSWGWKVRNFKDTSRRKNVKKKKRKKKRKMVKQRMSSLTLGFVDFMGGWGCPKSIFYILHAAHSWKKEENCIIIINAFCLFLIIHSLSICVIFLCSQPAGEPNTGLEKDRQVHNYWDSHTSFTPFSPPTPTPSSSSPSPSACLSRSDLPRARASHMTPPIRVVGQIHKIPD